MNAGGHPEEVIQIYGGGKVKSTSECQNVRMSEWLKSMMETTATGGVAQVSRLALIIQRGLCAAISLA